MPQEIAYTAIVKTRLQTIKLYFNEYVVLFTDQIFQKSLCKKIRPSICIQKSDLVFEAVVR